MAITIKKIKLINFKRFENYTIEPNDRINILVGDNEAGKSSILEAIDLVASGDVRRIEAIGLDKLLNTKAVQTFNTGARTFDKLPKLIIELYLELDQPDSFMNGKNNTEKIMCDGVRVICTPNPDYMAEITEALAIHEDYFPYDYYSIRSSTFADDGFSTYKRKRIRTVIIDSTNMKSGYATNDFVHRMYIQYTEDDKKERAHHNSAYRLLRNNFCSEHLKGLNERIPTEKNYSFGLKSCNSAELENNLMIYENEISIDSRGMGRQVFVKTDFALERAGDNVDVIMIEEPENHLSPVNLRKLIQRVTKTRGGQIFITTHNSLISTRLELQNLLIMHTKDKNKPTTLKDLSNETARYFMKAPPAGIVEYTLAPKTLLVEGPSEYMLLERFYQNITGHTPEEEGVHIIDIRGLSFLRYLEIAKLTKSKVAVITDNDKDYEKNCVDKYAKYKEDSNVEIFYNSNNEKSTFEIILYNDNKTLCDSLFKTNALNHMLNNKTEAAYILLSQKQPITVPDYIKDAIKWIRE